MKKIRVFTAFSGYDSQMMALRRLQKDFPGVEFDLVGWCEIDTDAINSHNAVFPEYSSRHYPDIAKVNWNEVPDFDWFTYSSCCQDVSSTGTMGGLEEGSGTRSALIWEVLKCIRIKRPQIAILENVSNLMSKTFMPSFIKWRRNVDSLGYRSEAMIMNACDFDVPQNRKRVFMLSFRNDIKSDFTFPEPIEPERCFEDFLETNVENKYYLSSTEVTKFALAIFGKAINSTTNNHLYGGHYIKRMPSITCHHKSKSGDRSVIPTIVASGYKHYRYKNCYTQGDYPKCRVLEVWSEGSDVPIYNDIIDNAPSSNTDIRNYSLDVIRDVIRSLKEGEYIRLRLMTPKEMLRFMGVEDAYIDLMLKKSGKRDSYLYKQAGNSIVVDVLYYIFKNLLIN